jgi:predicted GH43/DUF377 family glycosyl hydrolase
VKKEMNKKLNHELFQRHPNNPILSAKDWPYNANSVFNTAAAEADDKTILLVRVEDSRGISHFTVARSVDGVCNWEIAPQPTLMPEHERYPEEIWGIEDPRATWLEELQLRFNVRWAMFHRPLTKSPNTTADIWISYSPDLKHWGDHQEVIRARHGGWWDANKIGLLAPSLKTSKRWMVLSYGVRTTALGSIYRLGLAIMDLEEPTRLIRRADEWIFGPKAHYERDGDVDDVVFPCGWVVKNNIVYMYYGAADSCIALATAKLSDLVDFVLSRPNRDPYCCWKKR